MPKIWVDGHDIENYYWEIYHFGYISSMSNLYMAQKYYNALKEHWEDLELIEEGARQIIKVKFLTDDHKKRIIENHEISKRKVLELSKKLDMMIENANAEEFKFIERETILKKF